MGTSVGTSVEMDRAVGDDQLVDESVTLDSERPAYADEVYLLLTMFDRDFPSFEEAVRAVDAGAAGAATPGWCLDIRDFPPTSTRAQRPA